MVSRGRARLPGPAIVDHNFTLRSIPLKWLSDGALSSCVWNGAINYDGEPPTADLMFQNCAGLNHAIPDVECVEIYWWHPDVSGGSGQ